MKTRIPGAGSLVTLAFLACLALQGCTFDGGLVEQQTCSVNTDCRSGYSCLNGVCVPGDVTLLDGTDDTDTGADMPDDIPTGFACGDALCSDEQSCCANGTTQGVCVDTETDASNCGGCGVACAPNEICDAGSCTCGGQACGLQDRCCDTGAEVSCTGVQTDRNNCGGCGNVCNDSELCVNSLCVCEGNNGALEQCNSGQVCCGGLAGCRDLDTDPNHCGGCGVACGVGEVCVGGSCQCGTTSGSSGAGSACSAGEACCGSPQQCVSADNPVCDCNGAQCATGQLCCNVDTGDNTVPACVYVTQDESHCGACGQSCGAAQVCSGNSCVCEPGFADCNNDPSDGCEVRLDSDSAHCGACDNACDPGFLCDGGGSCAHTCQSGLIACDGVCVNPLTDNAWCGASGDCAAGNVGAVCDPGFVCDGAGSCDLTCQAGLIECSGTCIDPLTDRAFCGASGACTGAARGDACDPGFVCDGTGSCSLSCQSGLRNCDDTCVDVASNPAHCGACNAGCSNNEFCDTGSCACEAGFADCNNNPADGCETNLNDSETHCGACNRTCSSTGGTGTCVAGACQLTCSGANRDCDNDTTNGCETNTNSSTGDCGACGNDCRLEPNRASGGTCNGSGLCTGFTCTSGWTDCDIDAAGCETFTDGDPANCGACGNDCNSKASVDTAACDGGSCEVLVCDTGRYDCNGNGADGCESSTPCASCGNDLRENNEPCDGSDLGGLTCTDLGYDSGTLGCNAGCTDFNESGCAYRCGDNAIDPGETCDGSDLSNQTCSDFGFAGGTLTCKSDCSGFVVTACEAGCDATCGTSAACEDGDCRCGGPSGELCDASGVHHSAATCSSGNCALSCQSGFSDCNGDASDSCETPLGTVTNCQSCNDACDTNQVCGDSGCECGEGFADCGGDAACESNILTDESNCGGCGITCGSNATCVAGICRCTSSTDETCYASRVVP